MLRINQFILFILGIVLSYQPSHASLLARLTCKQVVADQISEVLIAEDQDTWANYKAEDVLPVFAYLDNSELNKAIKKAIEAGQTESELYDPSGPLHALGHNTFKKFGNEVNKIGRKTGLAGNYHFSFTPTSSTLMIQLRGRKADIEKSVRVLKLKKAWLGREGLVTTDENYIEVRDHAVFASAAQGGRTVEIRRGIDRGYQTGLGMMVLKNRTDKLGIFIEDVKEIRFADLTQDDLNGERPGLTHKEMFEAMKSYYSDFTEEDMVTVLQFRLR